MSGAAGLGTWLATLDAPRLAAILRARPDVARHPEPTDLSMVASRLSSRSSVNWAITALSRPALQVAETLLALGGSASREELHSLLGATGATGAAVEAVDAAIAELAALALAWTLQGTVRQVGNWGAITPDPLGLGRPAHELYGRLSADQLDRIGAHHGIRALGRAGIHSVVAVLTEPDAVRARLAGADPQIAAAVRRLATHGPRRSGVRFPEPGEPVGARQEGQQLAVQGWAVPTEWGIGEMPREIALAVRGPAYRAPFDAHPPRPATAPVDPRQLRAAGEHGALTALGSVRQLVTLLGRSPLATVRGGGIGVRELRRAAKEVGSDITGARLGLETARAAGLVTLATEKAGPIAARGGPEPPSAVALPTVAVDEWLAAEPAEAYARLLLGWWHLPTVPSLRVDESGRPAGALVRAYGHPEHVRMRAGVFACLAALDPACGLVETDALRELLAHRAPLDRGLPDDDARLSATLDEATRLGLVAMGALTPIGLELLAAVRGDHPHAALHTALAGMLPAPTCTASFLPDLTALVTGIAAPPLARLLDAAADLERQDVTSIWRFTAASVRRALDAGHDADELLTALAAAAERPLPQPLGYLVKDIARQHGQVQVVAVSACVRVADAALAAQLAAHRALAPLGLRQLADTVLVSGQPVDVVVKALRSAGFSPLQQDATGATVVERAPDRRAPAPVERSSPGPPTGMAALAARLTGVG